MVTGLLGNESSDSNRFTLVTPKSENDVRLQATLGNQNPTGLPVGVVRRNMNNLCSLIERRPDAVAMVRGSDVYRRIRGRVLFYGVEDAVAVRVEIEGLPRGRGPCQNPMFAFHIHSGTKCEGNPKDEFADAGMHYNPGNCKHPYHAGDMPPLLGVNGNALSVFLTDRFTIREIIGRVVIIHANPDGFMTQPSGNSGEKIACGVIKRAFR